MQGATAHDVYTGDLVPSVSIDTASRASVSISVQTDVPTIIDIAHFMGVPGSVPLASVMVIEDPSFMDKSSY